MLTMKKANYDPNCHFSSKVATSSGRSHYYGGKGGPQVK